MAFQQHNASWRRGAGDLAVVTALVLVASASFAGAQPASAPTATQPAGARTPSAIAVKVTGDVRAASLGEPGEKLSWRPVAAGDHLASGTLIRTGLRSALLLQFGDNVIVKIDRATSMTVAQFYRSAHEQRIKLDLGYGAVRAGVAEGAIQSDMTIETPVATLTRRGTWNFGIEYEAVSGRFRIFVEDHGVVDALDQLTRQRRTLIAPEYVTQAMIRWIETAKFDRYVPIQDAFGLTRGDRLFEVYYGTGRGVVNAGGGADTLNAVQPGAGLNAAEIVSQRQGAGTSFGPLPTIPLTPGVRDRPEGNFGTGGAVIPTNLMKKGRSPR